MPSFSISTIMLARKSLEVFKSVKNLRCLSNTKLTEKQKEIMAKGLPKQKEIPGVKNIILVSSGKGGVGKSTTAVNLAVSMANLESKPSVGLLDADVFGPSIPLMMNLKEEPLVDENNLMIPVMNYNVKCMSMGLLVTEESALVWRGLMVMSALERLLRHVSWGKLDCLIVDTPPGTGDTLLSLMQNLPISGVLIVTTPQQASIKVARRGATMIRKLNVPIIGIVQNMSSVVCPKCTHTFPLFNDNTKQLAKELEAPILCDIPIDPSIANYCDSGTPITVIARESPQAKCFSRLSEEVLQFLRSKNQESNS